MRYLLVLLGGGVGSLLRYLVATAVFERYPSRLPIGTITVNLTGAFAIGFLVTFCSERFPGSENWRPLLIVGLLGGYTTFSSLEWETFQLFRGGAFWMGAANAVGSILAGYAAVWLGALLARR